MIAMPNINMEWLLHNGNHVTIEHVQPSNVPRLCNICHSSREGF